MAGPEKSLPEQTQSATQPQVDYCEPVTITDPDHPNRFEFVGEDCRRSLMIIVEGQPLPPREPFLARIKKTMQTVFSLRPLPPEGDIIFE